VFEATHFGFDVVQALESRKSGSMNRFGLGKIDVLLKKSEFEIIDFDDLAFIRRFVAFNKAKNGRLTGAVATDQTNLFKRIYLKRKTAQNFVRAVGFFNL
jgi:ribosomal protein S18